jgi:thiol-disulfide isomerase/thioredoxin
MTRTSNDLSARPLWGAIAWGVALVLASGLALGLWGCGTGSSSVQTPGGVGQAENPSGSTSTSSNATAEDGAAATATGPVTAVEEGALAPDFSYTTVDGASGRLSELKGKVVLLNLWASWCGPCVQEMPDIAALKANYPALEVLAVNVSDEPADARAFIQKSDYDFSWVLDEQGTISAQYPTDGIPYTIIIDADGVIAATFLGSPSDAYAAYESALKQAGL